MAMASRWRWIVLAVVLAVAPSRARADEPGEVIEIWDERPEKPFDRDTELRLTGEELAARGATDLATALALVPDVAVRDAGRGGFNVDIRGARKGAVRVLVDGVAVSDPFYGTFDVSTIPITDIVQIRISTAPASPIDGPGGPGGVIEVHTRDAIGARLVVARLTSDSLPTFGATATGRTALTPDAAVRLSASSLFGVERYDTASPDVRVEDHRRATTGAIRVEHRRDARRIAVDGFVDDRRYVSPPSDELAGALILFVERETTGRIGVAYDDAPGDDRRLQVQGRAWLHATARASRNFADAALTREVNREDLSSLRAGGMALATRPIGRDARWVASLTVDHEHGRDQLTATGAGAPSVTTGDVTNVLAAGDAQLERGGWKLDGAAGLAVPLGVGAAPWPEAKLSARYQPAPALAIEAIAARKGRVPSLRERFQGVTANHALDPEMAWHGELRVTAHALERVELLVAPYARRTTGTVRIDPAGSGLLVNLGDLDVIGVDASATAHLHAMLELGGAYQYARASSADLGPDPLDRFPRHRADGWLRARPLPQVTALARARYVGRSIDQGATTPAYVLWELSATVALGGDWLGVVRCDDLLDVRPETRNGYHAPGRVVSLVLQGTWD
jgi:outer membrane cobalamin receptor